MTREKQLTFGNYGHMLNRRQAISPDGQWAVYDTRNDDTHIPRTDSIEMVHLDSGEIVRLYRTPTSSLDGPGVGAAAFHPVEDRVVFIHGLESCSNQNPYSAARRFGAIVRVDSPGTFLHAEARMKHNDDGSRLRADGVLSGGTHAHSWSHDGWLSFTYNDAWFERTARTDNRIRDLRTVGFMSPGRVAIDNPDGESFSGSMKAFLAAKVCDRARNGSDEIEQALEECWIGRNGYLNEKGVRISKALAFQGAIRNDTGEIVHEIFVCDLPLDESSNDGTAPSTLVKPSELLEPAVGCVQRRLTRSLSQKFPGVQGVRNWLVASADGQYLYSPMRDNKGIAQVNRIATVGGNIDQITDWEHSLEGQISLNSQGTVCATVCDQRVCLTHLVTGKRVWLTDKMEHTLSGAVHFVGEHRVVFNRFVGDKSSGHMQVFVCEME